MFKRIAKSVKRFLHQNARGEKASIAKTAQRKSQHWLRRTLFAKSVKLALALGIGFGWATQPALAQSAEIGQAVKPAHGWIVLELPQPYASGVKIAQAGSINFAEVTQVLSGCSGDCYGNWALIQQTGLDNHLSLVQNGGDNIAIMTQEGQHNRMSLIQTGDGNIAELIQIGDNLTLPAVEQSGGAVIRIEQRQP